MLIKFSVIIDKLLIRIQKKRFVSCSALCSNTRSFKDQEHLGRTASIGFLQAYFLSNSHLVPMMSNMLYLICIKLDLCESTWIKKEIEIELWFTTQEEISVYNNSQWMCLNTKPIKSRGTALNELWHGVLINVSCRHKMGLRKSSGFSFVMSNVGLGVHDGGALPLLTQSEMYSF